MRQKETYTRLSDILARSHPQEFGQADCRNAVALVEQIFRCVDEMGLEERQALMTKLTSLVIAKIYSADKISVLIGLHRYCVAMNLIEDPSWVPPKLRL